jgi:hypothetical protein
LQEFHEQGDPFTAPAGMVLQNAGDISAATDFDRFQNAAATRAPLRHGDPLHPPS